MHFRFFFNFFNEKKLFYILVQTSFLLEFSDTIIILLFQYRQYKLKDRSSGKFLSFRLCDSRGFEEDFSLDSQEISFILDGNMPDRYQVTR